MDRSNRRPYTYIEAGFNGFLSRSLSSMPKANTLRSMEGTTAPPAQINFDNTQISGSIGDSIEVDRILIDGVNGVIDIRQRDSDDVMVRVGELDG